MDTTEVSLTRAQFLAFLTHSGFSWSIYGVRDNDFKKG